MNATVVLSGCLYKRTQEVINTIRKWFDGELIISTWDNETTLFGGVDKYVYSKDPGGGPVQNVYRQICSSYAGIKNASNPIILRTRADIAFTKNPFRFIDKHRKNNGELQIFGSRIIYGSVNTFNHAGSVNARLFSPSDMWQCGHYSDMCKLSDLSLEDLNKHISYDMCAEQAWFLTAINKFSQNKFTTERTEENIKASYVSFINNLCIINSYEDAGVEWIKHDGPSSDWSERSDHYFHRDRWAKKYYEIYIHKNRHLND